MKKWLIVGIGAAGLLLSSVAMARVDIGIGVPGVIFSDPSYPAPVYRVPPPVVYVDPPVYYRPGSVRVQPRVVYPGPTYYYRGDYYREHRNHDDRRGGRGHGHGHRRD